jgi:hypothetical protein
MVRWWRWIWTFRWLMSAPRTWSSDRETSSPARWSKGDSIWSPLAAVLHHLPNAPKAIANLAASARRGGAILLIEPDFLPVSVAEPPEIREFWAAWLSWSRGQGIDYTIGRQVPERLAALGLEQIGATAETALYNGGSPWAQYWQQTIVELRGRLIESGELDKQSVDTFLAYCEDPSWWTQTIAFTAVHARVTR